MTAARLDSGIDQAAPCSPAIKQQEATGFGPLQLGR